VPRRRPPIKFQLDWRFEGPAALFLQPVAKGHFKAAGLDVTIDSGNGSGGTVTRVASGTYDMGFADMAALMEFHANNPDAPNKPVAVMMVYNNTPAAVLALKKSGITKPADLNGKKLGAPGLTPAARPSRSSPRPTTSATWPGPAWTRRCARPCWCAATSTPSPASRSPRCSTWKRAA
jgi:ABC-type nitrate/sulfonate/bicarbonate transport system substrate-binding protein